MLWLYLPWTSKYCSPRAWVIGLLSGQAARTHGKLRVSLTAHSTVARQGRAIPSPANFRTSVSLTASGKTRGNTYPCNRRCSAEHSNLFWSKRKSLDPVVKHLLVPFGVRGVCQVWLCDTSIRHSRRSGSTCFTDARAFFAAWRTEQSSKSRTRFEPTPKPARGTSSVLV